MRDISLDNSFPPCTMNSFSRSHFVDNNFILQPTYDKTSCRDSGITPTEEIYTLKLLVAYIFSARSSSSTASAGGSFVFFFLLTETPSFKNI